MDNASYHSRKLESLFTMSWTKPRIQELLTVKNIPFEAEMVKANLIDIVRQHKQEHCDKYAVTAHSIVCHSCWMLEFINSSAHEQSTSSGYRQQHE
ncbi:unnamed protein product [Euphydryas editha]|uniref:Uncharacterized protein n=1 Tax=Euphydryas editha TaxID=104508 RepID=A0AAU9TMF8_EUPED|nr:unnamed protein product [Euphydryas editha]